MKSITKAVVLLLLLTSLVTTFGCATTTNTQSADQEAQQSIHADAQAAVPVNQTQNFLARQAINEWLERQDVPNKLWYVYEHAEGTGVILGYYVSKTMPLSFGVSITNPQQIVVKRFGGVSGNFIRVMSAPAMDGVFYSGADPTLYYFVDAESDTMVHTNMKLTWFDKPLAIEAPKYTFIALD